MKSLARTFVRHLLNCPGHTAGQPCVVFESDDWGAVHTPSVQALQRPSEVLGELNRFDRIDSLLTEEDLTQLFNLLTSFCDREGNHPSISAFVVMTNPDFGQIKECGFASYHSEPLTSTFARTAGCTRSFELWKQAIKKGVLHPQYHCREHVHVTRWLQLLRQNHSGVRAAFDRHTYYRNEAAEPSIRLLAAYNYSSVDELPFLARSIEEGTGMFEQLFGFRPRSMSPPSYVWDDEIERVAARCGIEYIHSDGFQQKPDGCRRLFRPRRQMRLLGSTNPYGQTYVTRNVHFEPALQWKHDPVGDALERIALAFRWKNPAVISIHRANFAGTLSSESRDYSLRSLHRLLKEILIRWPEVRFVSSVHAGDLISRKTKTSSPV